MSKSSREAMAAVKGLCRTLGSAPNPHLRANEIFGHLARAEGWTPAQQAQIVTFGAWLGSRPPPSALKERCHQLLSKLQY